MKPTVMTKEKKIVTSKRFANAVQKIINRHDPVGLIAEGAPADEYEYQQAAIMRKLPACKSIERLQGMIYEEFCHWFNPEKAGPREKYKAPAIDLFRLYKEFQKTY